MNTTVEEAEELLESLVDAHLLEPGPTPGRYRFHDLLRLYARERVEDEETHRGREEAVRRMLGWYLDTADAASQLLALGRLLPQGRMDRGSKAVFATRAEALAWLEAERTSLVGATQQAVDCGLYAIAWQLPDALWSFFHLRKRWADWQNTHQVGLAAAREAHHRQAEARMLTGLGKVYCYLPRFDRAIDCFEQALAIHRDLGDWFGRGLTLHNLGKAYCELQRFRQAIDCHEQALTICREFGYPYGEGLILNSLGLALQHTQGMDSARACWRGALVIFTQVGASEAQEVRSRLEDDQAEA
jgi:tetratricopeptide (TPR) repeat protein